MAVARLLKVAGWCLVVVSILYFTVLLLLLNETLQRHALYAHKICFWWQDLDQPEQWGFLKNQVRPFLISTPDGQNLYAWHILPVTLYAKNEKNLLQDPKGTEDSTGRPLDVTVTQAFHLLRDDPESRLIISFHGNAGSVAQGWRTDTYRALAAGAADKIHVLTVDYRGYGYSTGSPTEQGLITDGIAVVDWALQVAQVPPERIVILGQSLGTAVTTAVVEHFTEQSQINFAGIVLIAAFSDLPTLMLTYAAGSVIPLLSPLRVFPKLQRFFAHKVKDTWPTVTRLDNIVRQSQDLRLVLIHAKNDYDIPWTHSNTLFYAAVNATSETGLDTDQIEGVVKHTEFGRLGYTKVWRAGTGQDGLVKIEQIILNDGGHNRIVTYAPVTKAVVELFAL